MASGKKRGQGQAHLPPDVFGEEEAEFSRAMQGVRPVSGGGRSIPAAAKDGVRREVAAESWESLLRGGLEFILEYSEEYIEGHVLGLDPLALGKLRAGQYSPEAHIDLHGMNLEQGHAALMDFIRCAYIRGQRAVLVVTGRGRNSPDGQGVLRAHLRDWLTRDPLKRVVQAFCTARPKDGGAGAVYLLLRKHKKRSGKIRWD
ncbi:MAG: Smr/MutS family endonuclease [Desulfovibrionaceae bacterium]|nr:Smr/MutS family endonuclease [Desulfovibrionaceae bacterium]